MKENFFLEFFLFYWKGIRAQVWRFRFNLRRRFSRPIKINWKFEAVASSLDFSLSGLTAGSLSDKNKEIRQGGAWQQSAEVTHLLLTQQPGFDPQCFPQNLRGNIIELVKVNQRCSLEDCVQWLENVDRFHLVLASGEPILHKIDQTDGLSGRNPCFGLKIMGSWHWL